MSSALRIRRSVQGHEALPADIYLPLVDSLYKDGRTLISGSIFVSGRRFHHLLEDRRNHSSLLRNGGRFCRLRARTCDVRIFARALNGYEHGSRQADGNIATLRERPRRSRCSEFGALSPSPSTSDPFAHLVSFSMTIGYAAGIFGRNFANARFVVVQIFCAWLPMTAALLFYGNPFHWIFAALLVPVLSRDEIHSG